jgi:hypothetical protein
MIALEYRVAPRRLLRSKYGHRRWKTARIVAFCTQGSLLFIAKIMCTLVIDRTEHQHPPL